MKRKNGIQAKLFWIFFLFLFLGVLYPPIAILALICMLAPVALAFTRGRFWCGNYCPRGSFYDHVLGRLSRHGRIPLFFRHPAWRLFMVGLILTVFSVQMYFAWGDLAAMGLVFWRIIAITTLVGIFLGLIWHERTWCAFCPMGTMAGWISKRSRSMPLQVADTCVACRLCSRVCPLQLEPYRAKGCADGFTDSDCIKCSRCVGQCPKHSLAFPAEEKPKR